MSEPMKAPAILPTPPPQRQSAVEQDGSGRLDRLEKRALNRQPIIDSIPTGWSLIDSVTHGLVRGEIVTLIGGPGTGKSTLADQIVLGAMEQSQDLRALVFSLETHPDVRIARLLANASVSRDGEIVNGVEVEHIQWGKLTQEEQPVMTATAAKIRPQMKRVSFIDDVYNAVDIASMIERENPDLVLLDHLGLVTCGEVGESSEVARLDAALGLIANSIRARNTAGLLINEVSRAAATEGKIDLNASRGSIRLGSLSALFIGLKWDPPEFQGAEPVITAQLSKNRFGPKDKQQLARFVGRHSHFSWGEVRDYVG